MAEDRRSRRARVDVSAAGWPAPVGFVRARQCDWLSDVDFIVVVESGRFEEAWDRRHDLHGERDICWDYPRPGRREVAAHRWLTRDFVLFDGLIATIAGTRIADPLVVLVGEPNLADRMDRFDPTTKNGDEIELHEVERLYGRLKLAARAWRRD
jgi:hypothetical protein